MADLINIQRDMRLLPDAHAPLCWLADDPALGERARALIADPGNEVLVSAATAWEISIKRGLGQLEAPADVASVLADEGFLEAPVLATDGDRAGTLDPIHPDPFDRMLVVQAARLDASIVTRDPVFERYGTRVIRRRPVTSALRERGLHRPAPARHSPLAG